MNEILNLVVKEIDGRHSCHRCYYAKNGLENAKCLDGSVSDECSTLEAKLINKAVYWVEVKAI